MEKRRQPQDKWHFKSPTDRTAVIECPIKSKQTVINLKLSLKNVHNQFWAQKRNGD